MIEQQGRVLSADGGTVRVALGGKSGCSACDAGRGCGAGVFGRLLPRDAAILEFKSDGALRAGDAVQVGIAEQRFLALVAGLYGLPLLAGLAGALAGYSLARSGVVATIIPGLAGTPLLTDLCSLLLAVLAALGSLAWVRRRLPVNLERLSLTLNHSRDGLLDCPPAEHH